MSPTPTDPRDVAIGLVLVSVRAGVFAGRIALLPAQLATRAPLVGGTVRRGLLALEDDGRRARAQVRAQLEAVTDTVLADPEVERVLDRALAGPLTEAIARSLVEHRVIERAAAEIAATTDIAATVAAALDSHVVLEVTDRVLASPEMQRTVQHIASSPELRRALTEQSSGLAEEMIGGLRERGETLDETAERAVRGWLRRPRPRTS